MPPVDEDCRQLLELYRQLEQVFGRKDWAALASTDLAIRRQLQALVGRGQLSPEASSVRQRLQQLHAQAYAACADECERLRRLLLSHLDYAEGRSAYLQVDSLRSRS
ncbi:hypothetical protein A9179_06065 [Pseudomonas alcaligenes]|uniref:Flagellar protein FliT n=1 Tax=Aquipseudomonas alcaligenes TaxID=43263 RepID=A0ABR7RWW5_AQUAC|nr:hypothetical protein [Pseudomonas alcaligenes]MBC9249837.1 hypothetical protein [Pseudomonas alcaligenes]